MNDYIYIAIICGFSGIAIGILLGSWIERIPQRKERKTERRYDQWRDYQTRYEREKKEERF